MATNSYDSFRKKVIVPILQVLGATRTVNSQSVSVGQLDGSGNVLRAHGTVSITNGGSGYSKGCIYIKTDAATGSQGLYSNTGTSSSCVFTQLGTSIAPTHVVVAAGTSQVVAAASSTTIAVTGVLPTDLAFAQLSVTNLSTNTVTTAKSTTSGVVMNFNAVVNSTSVVTYQVLRPVS